VLVASCTRALRLPSEQAAKISADFAALASASAGDSAGGTRVSRREFVVEKLPALIERDSVGEGMVAEPALRGLQAGVNTRCQMACEYG
jgi:hypothetical protein